MCLTLCDPMNCSLPGSSVHGIFQARILEWGAISFSRSSSWPRDWTRVSRIVGRRSTIRAMREESNAISNLTGGGAQAVMWAMGSSCKYTWSFTCSPPAVQSPFFGGGEWGPLPESQYQCLKRMQVCKSISISPEFSNLDYRCLYILTSVSCPVYSPAPSWQKFFWTEPKEELLQICVDKHDNSEAPSNHQSQRWHGWQLHALLEVLPLPLAHLTQRARWAVWQRGHEAQGEQQKSEQWFAVFVLLFCSCSMIMDLNYQKLFLLCF